MAGERVEFIQADQQLRASLEAMARQRLMLAQSKAGEAAAALCPAAADEWRAEAERARQVIAFAVSPMATMRMPAGRRDEPMGVGDG